MFVRGTVRPEVATEIRRRAESQPGYAGEGGAGGHGASAHRMSRRLRRKTGRGKGCPCENFVRVKIPRSRRRSP